MNQIKGTPLAEVFAGLNLKACLRCYSDIAGKIQKFEEQIGMKRFQRLQYVLSVALLVSLACAMTPAIQADDKHKAADRGTSTIDISNFGKVNDRFYRGAQPKDEDYEELAAIGVKTVIDLRDDAKSYAKPLAEQARLRYIHFPLDDKSYPAKDVAERFLKIANDPENWPIYVHCAGGRHRTGAMTAVYRMTVDGWDIDRAYREMKDFDFYSSWGHGPIKTYVYDYYRDLKSQKPVAIAEEPAKIDTQQR
jgi:protein tyrosine phosphatase (PTP) superfamily phosphohydrolase (DUF442 family)